MLGKEKKFLFLIFARLLLNKKERKKFKKSTNNWLSKIHDFEREKKLQKNICCKKFFWLLINLWNGYTTHTQNRGKERRHDSVGTKTIDRKAIDRQTIGRHLLIDYDY